MQWLIDTIKDWINAQGYALESWVEAKGYLTAGFVDRGDPAAIDFITGDFTKDGTWYDLDLSSIVPEGVKGVALSIIAVTEHTGSDISLRKNGNTNTANTSRIFTQVAFELISADMIVACDENRIIEYAASIDTWLILDITVKGWWF